MEVNVIRSSRKTISITLTQEGRVVVRAPYFLSDGDIQEFICSKTGWIEKHLARIGERSYGEPFRPEELQRLAREAAADLPVRAARFASIIGVSYGRITIRSQHTRWGSCSSRGNLNFNCLLMCAPPEVRDYVVVHELCHRKQMNHSPAFWAEVRQVLPDYEEQKNWLKTHGSTLICRLV